MSSEQGTIQRSSAGFRAGCNCLQHCDGVAHTSCRKLSSVSQRGDEDGRETPLPCGKH